MKKISVGVFLCIIYTATHTMQKPSTPILDNTQAYKPILINKMWLGNTQGITNLIESNIGTKYQTLTGTTPLMTAAKNPAYTPIFNHLLAYNSEPHQPKWLLQTTLENLTQKNNAGENAINIAAQNNNQKALKAIELTLKIAYITIGYTYNPLDVTLAVNKQLEKKQAPTNQILIHKEDREKMWSPLLNTNDPKTWNALHRLGFSWNDKTAETNRTVFEQKQYQDWRDSQPIMSDSTYKAFKKSTQNTDIYFKKTGKKKHETVS